MQLSKGALGLSMMVPLCAAIFMEAGGCSGDPTDKQGSGSAGRAGSAGASTGPGGAGELAAGGTLGAGGLAPDAACVATSAEAKLEKKPVDIIFIIDNSGSMTDNIAGVERNINQNFASIIGASSIDYRVIMLSEHGSADDQRICV